MAAQAVVQGARGFLERANAAFSQEAVQFQAVLDTQDSRHAQMRFTIQNVNHVPWSFKVPFDFSGMKITHANPLLRYVHDEPQKLLEMLDGKQGDMYPGFTVDVEAEKTRDCHVQLTTDEQGFTCLPCPQGQEANSNGMCGLGSSMPDWVIALLVIALLIGASVAGFLLWRWYQRLKLAPSSREVSAAELSTSSVASSFADNANHNNNATISPK